jgi:serine/threonine protein kinase
VNNFSCHSKNGIRWRVLADSNAPWLDPILRNPEQFLRDPALHLKNSKNVTLAIIPAIAGERPPLVLRRLNYGKKMHRVRDFFRHSRVQRALKIGTLLRQAGIRTPSLYAAGDLRYFRWPRKGYLLMDYVEHARTLSEVLTVTPRLPRRIVLALAHLLGDLHNRGFSHRDLKLTNVLIDPAGNLHLIDLDGVRPYRKLPMERALRDLARMGQELMPTWKRFQSIAWKFFLLYCRQRGLNNARELATRVFALSLERARQPSTVVRAVKV